MNENVFGAQSEEMKKKPNFEEKEIINTHEEILRKTDMVYVTTLKRLFS